MMLFGNMALWLAGIAFHLDFDTEDCWCHWILHICNDQETSRLFPSPLRETVPSHAGPLNDTSKTIESFV